MTLSSLPMVQLLKVQLMVTKIPQLQLLTLRVVLGSYGKTWPNKILNLVTQMSSVKTFQNVVGLFLRRQLWKTRSLPHTLNVWLSVACTMARLTLVVLSLLLTLTGNLASPFTVNHTSRVKSQTKLLFGSTHFTQTLKVTTSRRELLTVLVRKLQKSFCTT